WQTIAGQYLLKAIPTDNNGAINPSNNAQGTFTDGMPNDTTTIELTAPLINSQYQVGDQVSISATAAAADGQVPEVTCWLTDS
ncbi:hypothetical protein CWB96_22780, partial [Pseudoalteromonas citrea]